MVSELKNLELHYFSLLKGSPIMGRGEYVRLLLIDAGLDFKYVRHTFDEWKVLKQQLIEQQNAGIPTMPFMYIDGKYYSKTVPLMRFIARKLGQYEGKDDDENQLLDAYSDMIMDWATAWAIATFRGTDEQRENYKTTTSPEKYETWETILSNKKGPYVLGERITYVDFLLFHVLEDDDHVDALKHPNLSKFVEAMKNRPNLKPYLATDRK
ncbi:glutathione S-transferase [Mycotypha africana]|uniref:glutathione S-transferase n=1 Tax=Mycotypha africana TaxID=64632 RepID=UPI0023006E30|nr:glutathione S-transferase [Mycotypha africana]KAI8967885.1 glutathione S-transferase [Mycotypha africana]